MGSSSSQQQQQQRSVAAAAAWTAAAAAASVRRGETERCAEASVRSGETAATTTTTEGATLTFFVACFATLFFLGRWDVQSYERNKSEGAVRVSTRVHASLTLGVGCRQDAHLRFRSWFRGRPRLLGPHGLLRRCCVSLERNHMNAFRVSTREYATSSQGGRRRVGRSAAYHCRCFALLLQKVGARIDYLFSWFMALPNFVA